MSLKGSIDSIESLGLVDGPGIRTVVFLKGCKLRCQFCHNPEMWMMTDKNITVEELVEKILKNKPYFKRNQGGVTFSGGEPLLQVPFLIEVCKRLKENGIHIALDTAGVGDNSYKELLPFIDLVIFDVKAILEHDYEVMTGYSNIRKSLEFLDECQKQNKKMWIRQVIVPEINDNKEYIESLKKFLKPLKNIEKVELLPFHTMGFEKYKKLGIQNPLEDTKALEQEKLEELYRVLRNE